MHVGGLGGREYFEAPGHDVIRKYPASELEQHGCVCVCVCVCANVRGCVIVCVRACMFV
jgi:hypothetical protein